MKSASARISTPAQAGPLSLWLMRTRKDLMPWLGFGQGPGVSLPNRRVRKYAGRSSRWRVCLAVEMGDKNAALEALARVNNAAETVHRFSPEVAREERLYWKYTSGDYGPPAFYQKQRPVDESLDMIYGRVAGMEATLRSNCPASDRLRVRVRG